MRAPDPAIHVSTDEVRQSLVQILASRPFRGSKQCCTLLSYIVEHTLSGEDGLLRERVIGSEVFDRPPDYEPSQDPVVRMRASEIRKRLAQFYLSDSATVSVRIEVPPGSYKATFQLQTDIYTAQPPPNAAANVGHSHLQTEAKMLPVQVAASSASKSPSPHVSRAKVFTVAFVAALLLVLTAAALTYLLGGGSTQKQFRAFWAPWTSSPKPVIIAVGSNAVYRFSFGYVSNYAKQHGLEDKGQEIYIPFSKSDPPDTSQLLPAWNAFVALGDVAAISRIVATLTRQHQSFQERFPDDVSYAELQNTPSVLIGGFNNAMTMEMTKHLEFVMRGGNEIDDTLNPKRKWILNAPQDARDTADYAIVARLVRQGGAAPVISVAGLGGSGTLAAAEYISDPASIQQLSQHLPKGWADRNLQAVFRIGVIDFRPTPPQLIAYRSW